MEGAYRLTVIRLHRADIHTKVVQLRVELVKQAEHADTEIIAEDLEKILKAYLGNDKIVGRS